MEAYYEEVFFVGGTGLILNCIVAFKDTQLFIFKLVNSRYQLIEEITVVRNG